MIYSLRYIRANEWSNVVKYKNCFTILTAGLSRTGQRATGLTPEKEAELEKKLGFDPGTLAKTNDEYWDKFAIKVPGHGITLNTDNPLDELQYEFLSHYHRVANGQQNIRPNHDFVLANEEIESKLENIKNQKRRKAIKEFDKLSLTDMRKCLRLYGLRSDNMDQELVEARLFREVEKDPDKFLRIWVENPNKEISYIIEQAIAKNIIRRNKSIYQYGTDVIGHSLEDTISYLNDKKNIDLKTTILSELESKN